MTNATCFYAEADLTSRRVRIARSTHGVRLALTLHCPIRSHFTFPGKRRLGVLEIDVVGNLLGVGQNLQDHVLMSGLVFKYKGKMPDRDSDAVEAEAYL